MDWVVTGFAGVACLMTAVLFGLAPALHGARSGIGDVLRSAGRVAGHGRGALALPPSKYPNPARATRLRR